jgi:hypothetical protein
MDMGTDLEKPVVKTQAFVHNLLGPGGVRRL